MERIRFQEMLSRLKGEVTSMLKDVTDQFNRLYEALESMDKTKAEAIISFDEAINEKEDKINEDSFLIIAKECPVASDLRMIMTAIRIANDLERIGDYACNLAKYIIHTTTKHEYNKAILDYFKPLMAMFDIIQHAYLENDVVEALKVAKMDERIDGIYENHVKKFIRILKHEVDISASEAGRILFVIKQLERTGDHLTNISEAIIYCVRAERLTLN